MSANVWVKGDLIVHSARPEWGQGQVLAAEAAQHEGKQCQRLTIRFDRAGTKTLSTAFAELKPAAGVFASVVLADEPEPEDTPPPARLAPRRAVDAPERAQADQKPSLDPLTLAEVMTKLPESVRDPFIALRKRVASTLDLYRFSESGGALLDWAASQTGLKDPLSRFSRHELEQWFQRFRMDADHHLRKLARELRKAEPGAIDELFQAASPAGKQAMRRADFGRA
ncbi:MAG: DUF3553 domain-containing protein [Phycisphaerales bacterium]